MVETEKKELIEAFNTMLEVCEKSIGDFAYHTRIQKSAKKLADFITLKMDDSEKQEKPTERIDPKK